MVLCWVRCGADETRTGAGLPGLSPTPPRGPDCLHKPKVPPREARGTTAYDVSMSSERLARKASWTNRHRLTDCGRSPRQRIEASIRTSSSVRPASSA